MIMKKYINQYINNILLVSQTSMISIQFISVLVRDRDMNKLGEFQGKKQGHTKKVILTSPTITIKTYSFHFCQIRNEHILKRA